MKYKNLNLLKKEEKINISNNIRYIYIPKNIKTKEAIIALYTYALDLDIHSFNWDAFADGLGNVNIKYKQIIVEHEDVPNLDSVDLATYLSLLNDNSSLYSNQILAKDFFCAFFSYRFES